MIPYHWQYLPLLLQVMFAIGLASIMVLLSWFVGRHRNLPVKLAAYECGIEAVGDARARFSVRFYMVAMLFILFDVEAVFMMPWAVIYRKLPAHHWPTPVRLLGDGGLSRIRGRRPLLHRAQRHPELEPGQGGPLGWPSFLKTTLTGKAEVLEGLPDHPAIKAILAWNADALTDALFDRDELTLTIVPEAIREAAATVQALDTTSSKM